MDEIFVGFVEYFSQYGIKQFKIAYDEIGDYL